jgi:DNA-binding NtrC family response regulator
VKVLVTKPSLYERDELEEFFQSQSWEPFFAEEPRTMYQMLSRDDYDVVLYNLSSTDDFAAIRYINRNYPNIRVIVSTDDRLVSTIRDVRAGKFTVTGHLEKMGQLEKLFPEKGFVCPDDIDKPTKENDKTIKRTKRVKEKS